MKFSSKFSIVLGFLFAAFLAVSCVTGPVEIPPDLTPMEYIQRAQEASDRNKYSISLQYYEALIEHFPYDIDLIITAEYEIAFIRYKQRKYDQAKAELNNLLERYNTPDEALLPPQYKVLAVKVLSSIAEKEKIKKKR